MATNPDFKDLFSAFSAEAAEFIVVGAHAVMYFTEPRYTKDLDIWVRPSAENAERVHLADLLDNKRAVGRPQDLLDVEKLERAQRR